MRKLRAGALATTASRAIGVAIVVARAGNGIVVAQPVAQKSQHVPACWCCCGCGDDVDGCWCDDAGCPHSAVACAIAWACATCVTGANSTVSVTKAAIQRRTGGGRRSIR